MFYSKTTNGFYDPNIQYSSIPDDVVEVTQEQYQSLMAGQANNKVIVADQDGSPVLSDPPSPSSDEVKRMRAVELKQLLRDTDYVALSDYDKDKPDIIANRQAWREELRSLGG